MKTTALLVFNMVLVLASPNASAEQDQSKPTAANADGGADRTSADAGGSEQNQRNDAENTAHKEELSPEETVASEKNQEPPQEKKEASMNAPASPHGVWSLLPAFLAILLALWTKQVLIALLGGIWSGVLIQHGLGLSFPKTLDVIVQTAADVDKLKVITFTMALGGMVGIVAASGGTRGIVEKVSRFAHDARSSSIATWVMGLAVFFDDYASTLLTGSTMRPVTDRARVSREKLSYIVDSTAAPIASLALVSTWIGYEVSVLGEAMTAAKLPGDPYDIFIQGIPSRFYPIFALAFVFMVAFRKRDFGPMFHAEQRAFRTGQVLREGASPLMDAETEGHLDVADDKKPMASLAIVPIVSLMGALLLCLWVLGSDASYDALLYGAAVGMAVAGLMPMVLGRMNLEQVMNALTNGIRSTTLAIIVLVLAWSVGKVMNDLQAGPYVAALIHGSLPASLLPTVTFLLAGVMALATGTSWGTMAILFPIVIPVVAMQQGHADFQMIFLGTSSAVLAGAVFGDHCSPISDTTVLSSIASGADHVDHVRTQLPYALVCGGASVLFGTLPVGFGFPPVVSLILGLVALWGVLQIFGADARENPDK